MPALSNSLDLSASGVSTSAPPVARFVRGSGVVFAFLPGGVGDEVRGHKFLHRREVPRVNRSSNQRWTMFSYKPTESSYQASVEHFIHPSA
jgi:hypothetical protein